MATENSARGEGSASLLLPLALIIGLILLLSLEGGTGTGEEVLTNPLEPWLKFLVGYLAVGAELAAGVVIGVAIVRGLWGYIRALLAQPHGHPDATETIRLGLGRALALGLEFTVASDILRTAVAPTRQDILNLGAIVMLRTLLNYFLEREIRHVEAQERAGRSVGLAPAGEGQQTDMPPKRSS